MKTIRSFCASLSFAVAFVTASAGAYTSKDYVKSGLVLQLDGIANAGYDGSGGEVHNAAATTWKDLSGNGYDATGNTTVSKSWEANCLHQTNSLALLASISVSYRQITVEFYYVREDASVASGSYFWGSPAGGRMHWYINKTTESTIWTPGVNYAAKLGVQDGSHIARIDELKLLLWSADDNQTSVTLAANTAGADPETSTFYIGRNSSTSFAKGRIYAVRVYNRPLTDTEIRWNAAIDRARFSGETPTGEVTVTGTYPVGTPSPAYGASSVDLAQDQTFTMGGLVTHGDYDGAEVVFDGERVRYVFGGYAWQTGVVNPQSGSGSGSSLTLTTDKLSLFNDVDWKFEKQYRLAVSTEAGGTLTYGGNTGLPAVTNWAASGTETVRAVPDAAAGYSFDKWTGDVADVADVTAPEITVPVQSRDLRAIYHYDDPSHVPVTTAWKTTSGNWSDAANWDNGVPQKGDTVVISNVSDNATIMIDRSTSALAVLAVGNTNGKKTTIVLPDWVAKITAATMDLGRNVTVTCAGPAATMSAMARVWLTGGTLRLSTGAAIDVTALGFAAAKGPCWPTGTGETGFSAVYGGQARHSSGERAVPYGSAENPTDPGSGANKPGGGAVLLDFTGDVMIDGDILACGQSYYNASYGAGSGGGIRINCRTVSGLGAVRADGRAAGEATSGYVSGGGGRIAVHYDPAAQSNVVSRVRFSAAGGATDDPMKDADTDVNSGATTGKICENNTDPGTLWLPDNQFLSLGDYPANGLRLTGCWAGPEPLTSLHYTGNLVLDNCQLFLPAPDFALTVGGNFSATGPATAFASRENGLVLSNATVEIAGDATLDGARFELRDGGWLHVGGDLSLLSTGGRSGNECGGGGIAVYAAATNAPNTFGAEVVVDGTWHLADKSRVLPYCEPMNGAIIRLQARNVVMDAGSLISADRKGYGPQCGPGASLSAGYAATYGGKGGATSPADSNLVAAVYGSERRPTDPGSGGNLLPGGGVVYLKALSSLTLNGTISADGNHNHTMRSGTVCTGSSGGAICLETRTLKGTTGVLRARGGVASYKPGYNLVTGGGGRISVTYARTPDPGVLDALQAQATAAAGVVVDHDNYSITAWRDETHSEDGTVFWCYQPSGLSIIVR